VLLLPSQPHMLSALLPPLLPLSVTRTLLRVAALPAGRGLLLLILLLGFVALPGRTPEKTGGDCRHCCCCCCVLVQTTCSCPTNHPCCALLVRLPGAGLLLLLVDVGFCQCSCCRCCNGASLGLPDRSPLA
jgi:hypothetical protein